MAWLTTTSATAADNASLWQVGKPDHSNSEFAFAPGGFSKYGQDGFFLVGASDTKQDWPYVHPGLHLTRRIERVLFSTVFRAAPVRPDVGCYSHDHH